MTDYDASNERHIAIQRRVAKALDEAHDTVIHAIMGVADGRAYVYDLLLYCHVFDQPFSPDSHLTAFGCGQLDVGQASGPCFFGGLSGRGRDAARRTL